LEKRDIAIQQLEDAVVLYEKGHFISALTLSGAAEEILGKIAQKRNGSNELNREVEYLKSVYRFFNGSEPSNRELIKRINNAKNETKHNDSGENLWVDSDFENECVLLFVKAVKNYYNAYNDYPPYESGMPQYVRLKNMAVEKKLKTTFEI